MRATLSLFKYGSTAHYPTSTLAHLTNAAAVRAKALAALSQADPLATSSPSPSSSQLRPVIPPPRLPRPPQSSAPAPGGGSRTAFTLPCRKVLIHYCPSQPSSAGTRKWLEKEVRTWAEKYPTVEWVVSPRKAKHPVLIAEYSKSGCVAGAEAASRQCTG
ncbi:hypothetical protein V8E36_002591 [Tilletia maclaganii]